MNYRLMLMTGSSPVFYPDDPPAAAAVETPPLPDVEDPIELPEPKEPTAEEKAAADKAAADAEAAKPKPKEEAKPKEPTAEEKAAAEAAKVPETYTLTAGEGIQLDTKLVEQATPIFKELGLNNVQAQKVVDLYAGTVLPEVAQTVQNETLRLLGLDGMAGWAKAVKADKEIGGAAYEETLAMAAAGRDRFATPELRALLETSRLGNHPEVLRFFAKVGKATAEGAVHGDSSGKTTVTGAEAFYGPEFAPKS
jgi:hypothetical protein